MSNILTSPDVIVDHNRSLSMKMTSELEEHRDKVALVSTVCFACIREGASALKLNKMSGVLAQFRAHVG